MSEEASYASGEQETIRHAEHAPSQQVLGEGLNAPETVLPSLTPTLLPGNPRLKNRGNQSMRIAVMQHMQQTHGNRAVARLLQRAAGYSPVAQPPTPGLQPVEVGFDGDAGDEGLSLDMLPEPTNIQPLQTRVSSATADVVLQRVRHGTVSQGQAKQLVQNLEGLIKGGTWEEIRKRVYPKESAAGIKRAKERKEGKLPDLKGLGRITTIERFAEAVRVIQKDWTSLTQDARVQALHAAANIELKTVGVPEFLTAGKEKMPSKAYFSSPGWGLMFSEELIGNPSLSDADAAELANTTLHESRHAEQAFLAARYDAGTAILRNYWPDIVASAWIATNHKIPWAIAGEAVNKKMDPSTDPAANLGQQMYQSNVTDGNKNQAISDAVAPARADLDKIRKEAEVALSNLKASITQQTITNATTQYNELEAQISVVEQKYADYRNIPYEADAHEVGDAVEQAFKGWP